MKKNYRRHLVLLALCMAFLTGCGTSGSQAAADEQQPPAQEDTAQEASTLEDLLGEDYIALANAAIQEQIAQDPQRYFAPEKGGFTTITPDTPFYLDEEGRPVVVFQPYEIAPGSEGKQEFVILLPEGAKQ